MRRRSGLEPGRLVSVFTVRRGLAKGTVRHEPSLPGAWGLAARSRVSREPGSRRRAAATHRVGGHWAWRTGFRIERPWAGRLGRGCRRRWPRRYAPRPRRPGQLVSRVPTARSSHTAAAPADPTAVGSGPLGRALGRTGTREPGSPPVGAGSYRAVALLQKWCVGGDAPCGVNSYDGVGHRCAPGAARRGGACRGGTRRMALSVTVPPAAAIDGCHGASGGARAL